MTLGLMPLRGGSVSIPLKNIKPFNGRPLYQWNMEALVESSVCDQIYVNTDNDDIAQDVATNFPMVHIRKVDHIPNDCTTIEVVQQVLEEVPNNDIFVLTQATAPYLKPADAMAMHSTVATGIYDSVMSGAEFHRFVWDPETGDSLTGPKYDRRPRQENKPLFLQNGCIYVTKVEHIQKYNILWGGKLGFYCQPYGFEIDYMDDWVYGETVLRNDGQGGVQCRT